MSDFSAEHIIHDDGKIVLCRLQGELVGNNKSWEFLNELRREAEEGSANVILNMADLQFITSAGIGVIAAACATATKLHKSIVFSDVRGPVKRALDLVGIFGKVDSYDNDEDAFHAIRSA